MVAHALIRSSDGRITNRVAYNDGDPLVAPAGHYFKPDHEGLYEINGTLINNVYTPPAPTPLPPWQIRRLLFLADASAQEIIDKIDKATLEQIDTWLANNMTTLAQARAVMGAVIKLLVIHLARRE